MLLRLEEPERTKCSNRVAFWKKAPPFVENKRGVLIHRPRTVGLHKLRGHEPHYAIHYWCGNQSTGSNNFTFMDKVVGRVVCARCESEAIENGLPSSSELSGHHVCIGGVKAFSFCCQDQQEPGNE